MTPAPTTALLALDWGTTSARAYRLSPSGEILGERHGDFGIQHVVDGRFGHALADLLGDWIALDAPRLACGMIGSRQGWTEAPYRECPVAPAELATGLVTTPGGELSIVSGIMCRDDAGVPDVIRGEETQVAGLVATQACAEAVIVQPGTHSKWTIVREGRIVRFATYMTGEIYAVLRTHSILGRLMTPGAAEDRASFERGVRRATEEGSPGDLLHRLFGARTLGLFGELPGAGIADYLSGLLIGAEIAAGRAFAARHAAAAHATWLLGTSELCARYASALALCGIDARTGPADAAAHGLWRLANDAGLVA